MNLELSKEVSNISEYMAWESFEIKDQRDLDLCSSRMVQIAGHKKRVWAERDKVSKPLKEALKQFEQMVKNVTGPLDELDLLLRRKWSVFVDSRRKELEAKAEAERAGAAARVSVEAAKAIDQAMESGSSIMVNHANSLLAQVAHIQTADVKDLARQTVRLETGRVAQMIKKRWRVVDESKIPRSFLCIDEKKINAAMKAEIQIEGIEYFEESIPMVQS